MELIGYTLQRLTSLRLRYLVTTEIISSAFKKILYERLRDSRQPSMSVTDAMYIAKTLTVRYLKYDVIVFC